MTEPRNMRRRPVSPELRVSPDRHAVLQKKAMALFSESARTTTASKSAIGGVVLVVLLVLNMMGTQRLWQRQKTDLILEEKLPSRINNNANIDLQAFACPDTTKDPSIHNNYTTPMHRWKLPGGNPHGVTISRIDRFPTRAEEPVADYSYSRFAEAFYLDSQQAIHFVIMSDRISDWGFTRWEDPFPALVNSLLLYSSMPIVMHIVTRYPIPWLDDLDSPFFQVNFYNYERLGLLGHALRLQKKFNFQSTHKSMPMPMVKLFFSALPLPRPPANSLTLSKGIENLLLVDDDITFLSDPAKLWRLLDPHRLALNCPTDLRRIKKFFIDTNMTSNGHKSRYCNSGMINLPIPSQKRRHPLFGWTNDLMDMYINTTNRMTTEYPDANYLTADQDIYNRILADHEDLMDMIPCQWHCDFNSCKRGNTGTCSNCPNVGVSEDPEKRYCHAFHYVSGSYKFRKKLLEEQGASWVAPPTAKTNSYVDLWALKPLQTLVEEYLPRVGCNKNKQMN